MKQDTRACGREHPLRRCLVAAVGWGGEDWCRHTCCCSLSICFGAPMQGDTTSGVRLFAMHSRRPFHKVPDNTSLFSDSDCQVRHTSWNCSSFDFFFIRTHGKSVSKINQAPAETSLLASWHSGIWNPDIRSILGLHNFWVQGDCSLVTHNYWGLAVKPFCVLKSGER